MELKNKEPSFRKIQKKIKNNSQLIFIYKFLSPILMVLFILMSFLTLYENTDVNENSNHILYISLMVSLFTVLTLFHISIDYIKKQNKTLDSEIYDLLEVQ